MVGEEGAQGGMRAPSGRWDRGLRVRDGMGVRALNRLERGNYDFLEIKARLWSKFKSIGPPSGVEETFPKAGIVHSCEKTLSQVYAGRWKGKLQFGLKKPIW